MASESITSEEVNRILFLGTHQYKWDDLGPMIVFNLFGTGTKENIELKVSGLDDRAREYVSTILELANVLVSVGKFDFENSFEKRLSFIRTLQDPIFLLFKEHLNRARIEQGQITQKAIENLKKGQRTHSSEPSGSP